MARHPDLCFTPVGDKILVRRLQPEKEGLIYIPEQIDDARTGINEIPAILAEVVSVGHLKESRIMPGMKVQMSPYSGTEIRLCGEKLIVYNERDLLAVVE